MEYGKRPTTCWLVVFGEIEPVEFRTGDVQERLYWRTAPYVCSAKGGLQEMMMEVELKTLAEIF